MASDQKKPLQGNHVEETGGQVDKEKGGNKYRRFGRASLGVVYQLRVEMVRDVAYDQDGESDDLFGIQRGERSKDFIRTGVSHVRNQDHRMSIVRINTYLGLFNIVSRILMSCATMHRMFK